MRSSVSEQLSTESLVEVEQGYRLDIERSFSDGSWIQTLPGREILKQLVALDDLNVGYEILRNLIVSRMVERGLRPDGMKCVVEKILSD